MFLREESLEQRQMLKVWHCHLFRERYGASGFRPHTAATLCRPLPVHVAMPVMAYNNARAFAPLRTYSCLRRTSSKGADQG